ncbi:MAG: hypothetical protein CEO22_517 [Candidatus Berkelbacteria bacterium Gr01-1014_85]|uniref:Dienelactone hydrolase domain-containing protein n=1 Tax=Candidatus Berkelbacteria bacterium Gr01-1014_85 TaxID=2017150 RepID=A0A554JAG3_9BACT|nr:MAG: hypothetical protein CEO22_517 [Candidatus Berkelbacteria bacterium Gr01-1014_85]
MQQKKYVTTILARQVKASKVIILTDNRDNLSNNFSLKLKSVCATVINCIRFMVRLSPSLPFLKSAYRHREHDGTNMSDEQSKKAIALIESYFQVSSEKSASIHSKLLTMYQLYSFLIDENISFNGKGKVLVIIFPNIFGLSSWHTGIAKLFSALGADVLMVNYFDKSQQPNPFSLLLGNDSRFQLLNTIKTVDESTIITEIFDLLKILGDENNTRVYILGSSYGATLAMKLASAGDPRFRFLCLFYPSLFYRDGFTLIGGVEDILTQFRNIFAEIRIFIGEKDNVLHPLNSNAFKHVSNRVTNISSFILHDVDHAYVEPYVTRVLPSFLYKPLLSWLTIIYFIIFVYDDLNHQPYSLSAQSERIALP